MYKTLQHVLSPEKGNMILSRQFLSRYTGWCRRGFVKTPLTLAFHSDIVRRMLKHTVFRPKGSVRFIRHYQFLKIARSLAMLYFVHIYKKFVLATVMNGQPV
jgi:hypothetical protein